MPRSARLVLVATLCATAIAGCGSSDNSGDSEPTARATTPSTPPGAGARVCKDMTAGTSQVRVTGVACGAGLGVVAAWTENPACAPTGEESRSSCSVGDDYRCLGATVEQGVAVSCSAPGRSVSFLARRG